MCVEPGVCVVCVCVCVQEEREARESPSKQRGVVKEWMDERVCSGIITDSPRTKLCVSAEAVLQAWRYVKPFKIMETTVDSG